MTRAAVALVILVASLTLAVAETSLVFGGDRFVRKYTSGNDKARLIEFVPPEESIEDWTQLIGYRAIFDSSQTAGQAAAAIAAVTTERYPAAKPRVRTKGGEALVDFVIAPPNSDLVEFNVFKYARGHQGRGVLSFQYARRFRGLDPEDVRVLGGRWVAEAAAFDMERVRAALERD